MKYCETCAGANEDNALECKYCHAKFSISKGSSETELPVTFESQNNFSGMPSCDSISEVRVENEGVSNYISTLSTGMFVFWCICFGLIPLFGLIMTNIVWGKEGGKQLFIMRLISTLCLFVPSVLFLLLLFGLSFL
jgi:hypothetical protein